MYYENIVKADFEISMGLLFSIICTILSKDLVKLISTCKQNAWALRYYLSLNWK